MKLSWAGEPRQGVKVRTDSSWLARYLLPGIPDVLFLAVFAAVIGLGPRLLNVDGDLGRHIAIGEYILDTGSIPTRDLFSHTLYGAPLTPHEWLAQVGFALAERAAGLNGVVVLCALLIAGTFSLVYRQCLNRSPQTLVALVFTLLAAAAASLHWLARPHLYTLLLAVMWVQVLEGLRTGQTRRWWWLPTILLAWANLHGGFLVGFAIWGIYVVGELLERRLAAGISQSGDDLRRLLAGGAAALLASLANPAGWRLWQTSLGFLASRYLVGHTAEYLPPDFQLRSTWPFLLMITLSLVLFGSNTRRLPIAHLMLVAGWTVMALVSTRNIPLYAVLVAPVLAQATGQILEQTGNAGRFSRLASVEQNRAGHLWSIAGAGLIAITLLSGARLDSAGQGNSFDPQVFPVAAVDWLESQPDLGPVFNSFPWGGYLLYREWPELRVFIDGQTDFYGERLTRQYEQVITLQPGWEAVLQEYRVRWVIMPPGSPLVAALATRPGWQVLYEDGTAAIVSYGR